MINAQPEHLAVLGSPIKHSKSPAIHRAAYRVLNLPWSYSAFEVLPHELERLTRSVDPHYRGFSVTMPLKERAFELAESHDEVAQSSSVVNTLVRRDNRWHGANTDVPGLALALAKHQFDTRHTVVIGAGATAVSAVLAARQLGAERIDVLARRRTAAEHLEQRFEGAVAIFSEASLPGASAVISTIPGSGGSAINLPADLMQVPLFDVAYDPWPSPLSERWRQSGGLAVSGIDMLIFQALLQVRLFVLGDAERPLPDEVSVLAAMRAASVEE